MNATSFAAVSKLLIEIEAGAVAGLVGGNEEVGQSGQVSVYDLVRIMNQLGEQKGGAVLDPEEVIIALVEQRVGPQRLALDVSPAGVRDDEE